MRSTYFGAFSFFRGFTLSRQGLNDAERAKIYAAIEKLQAGPVARTSHLCEAGKGKHDLRITVAELLLAAPENDMEKSIDRVMQDRLRNTLGAVAGALTS